MSTLNIAPTNKSFLSNNKFDFILDRIPNLTFFVQAINLPSISLTNTAVASPAVTLSIPGNIILFNQVVVSFIIDENMESWFELYDWMFQLGNPRGTNKIGRLTGRPGTNNSIYSDGSLLIKTNSNNPSRKITFKDMYPVDLGEIQFSATDSTQEFLTSTATFNFTYYEYRNL
jgi:hypothetical protein